MIQLTNIDRVADDTLTLKFTLSDCDATAREKLIQNATESWPYTVVERVVDEADDLLAPAFYFLTLKVTGPSLDIDNIRWSLTLNGWVE